MITVTVTLCCEKGHQCGFTIDDNAGTDHVPRGETGYFATGEQIERVPLTSPEYTHGPCCYRAAVETLNGRHLYRDSKFWGTWVRTSPSSDPPRRVTLEGVFFGRAFQAWLESGPGLETLLTAAVNGFVPATIEVAGEPEHVNLTMTGEALDTVRAMIAQDVYHRGGRYPMIAGVVSSIDGNTFSFSRPSCKEQLQVEPNGDQPCPKS